MGIFGDVERLLAALYPYRIPLALVALLVAGAVAWVVVRRGAHRPVLRLIDAHRRASLALAVLAIVVAVPLGNYLLSPLWERSALIEASPLEVAAGTTPSAVAAPTGPAAAAGAATTPPGVTPPGVTPPGATPPSAAAPVAPALPRLVSRGMFAGADEFHFGRGDALLIEVAPQRHTLRFEQFSVRNGPDLFVYLSDDPKGYGDSVLKLGRLRATDGSFNYEVPEGTDISRFRSAIVWCEQFAVLFATAPLR